MTEIQLLHEPIPTPLSTEQLLPLTAEERLYDIYTDRITSIGGFRQRRFTEARADFTQTVHNAQPVTDIDSIRGILHMLIKPESYDMLKSDLAAYWQEHNLEAKLRTHSIALLTNHRAFSDLPVAAGAVCDMRHETDPHASSRNITVVGRMIPGMEIDIFNTGDYMAVTPLLSLVTRQVQTVPKLPKDASDEMKALRFIWNTEAKTVIETASTTPGHILYEAGSGTHDEVADNGKKLIMKSVNPETARMLCSPRLIVVPLFFSCVPFGEGGIAATDAKYRLLAPRIMHEPDQVWDTMRELAAAGSELLIDEFPKGVEYDASFKDRAHRAGKFIAERFNRDGDDSEVY